MRSKRKLVCGVGHNDVGEQVINCKYYKVWAKLLHKCHVKKSYTMCEEWLTFSVFRQWMMSQHTDGTFLNEVMFDPCNRHYSPDRCVFVSKELNKLSRYISRDRRQILFRVTGHELSIIKQDLDEMRGYHRTRKVNNGKKRGNHKLSINNDERDRIHQLIIDIRHYE